MEDRFALVGISADGQSKVLAINATADEAQRLQRALDRMKAYPKIELVPMHLLPPEQLQN